MFIFVSWAGLVITFREHKVIVRLFYVYVYIFQSYFLQVEFHAVLVSSIYLLIVLFNSVNLNVWFKYFNISVCLFRGKTRKVPETPISYLSYNLIPEIKQCETSWLLLKEFEREKIQVWRIPLQDSRYCSEGPPHLAFDYSFLIIRLSCFEEIT